MTTDSMCRRCSFHFFTGGESQTAYGVLAAKYDDPDPRFRTRVVGEFSPRHSGPYCRSCAYDRQRELQQQDRRSAKRLIAKQNVANVESDDCALIAMMKTTGRAYSAVQRAARKVGYRPGCGGMSLFQQYEMAERLGFRMVSALDGGVYGGSKMTLGQLMDAGLHGTVYVRVLGHAFPVDLDSRKVFNHYSSRAKVLSVHRLEKINEDDFQC